MSEATGLVRRVGIEAPALQEMAGKIQGRPIVFKTKLILLMAAVSAAIAVPQAGNAEETTMPTESATAPAKTGHIEVNGVNYYYEVRGEGEPLLLLHGGLGSIDMFGPLLPFLLEKRQVIGVDLHGHGRTDLGDRPINLPRHRR